jgi:O-antigen/teichoic acid export membrane protein
MRKISTNILFSITAELSQFIFSFFLGVLTARYLGAAGKGSFWLVYNVAGLLCLFLSMRFHRSLTYHLSKNTDLLGEVILYGLMLCIISVSCIAVVTTVFSSLFLGAILKDVKIHWAVLVLISLSHYLWLMIIGVIEGLFLFKAKAFFLGGTFLLKCILVFLALGLFQMNFEELILFMGSVETIILFGIVFYFLIQAKHFFISFSGFLKMVRYSTQGFLSMVSDLGTLRLDVFLVNYFSGPAQVGIYSVAVSLASILLYLPTAVRNVLLPYIASYADQEITSKLTKILRIMMILSSFILIPLVWVGVIPIYGEEFAFSRGLFLILLPGALFFGVFSLLSSDIEGRGTPWRISNISVISALFSIGLNLILIPMWNSLGAAVVSSITCGLMMILASRIYKRMVGMPTRELLVPKGADIGIFIETTNLFLINIRERLSASFFAKKPGT